MKRCKSWNEEKLLLKLLSNQMTIPFNKLPCLVTRPTNIKELKSYKDKSIHFAMISTLLASAGIYTPFVNLVSVIKKTSAEAVCYKNSWKIPYGNNRLFLSMRTIETRWIWWNSFKMFKNPSRIPLFTTLLKKIRQLEQNCQ